MVLAIHFSPCLHVSLHSKNSIREVDQTLLEQLSSFDMTVEKISELCRKICHILEEVLHFEHSKLIRKIL